MSPERRRRGRPALPPNRRSDITLKTFVTEEEADMLYSMARAERQSVSDFLRDAWRARVRMVIYPKRPWPDSGN